METGPPSDRRVDIAARASLAWYEDVFQAHRIPTRCDDGLWSALGDPPRWHSMAKTLRPGVPEARVLDAVDRFQHCSVADSYGTLDLSRHGFDVLFEATWLIRPAPTDPTPSWPEGWSVVSDEDELGAWNTANDTTGVLLPALLHHPSFTFLVRRSSEQMVAGAALHRVDDAVELSNTWALGGEGDEISSALRCAEALHPQLPVVGYSRNDILGPFAAAGFDALGPHIVWVREA